MRLEQTGFERVPNAEAFVGGYDAGWKEVLGWFAEQAMSAGERAGDGARGDGR